MAISKKVPYRPHSFAALRIECMKREFEERQRTLLDRMVRTCFPDYLSEDEEKEGENI